MVNEFVEIEKYLKQIESDKSKHTLRSYANSIGRFVDTCGVHNAQELVQMTSAQVQDYLYSLKDSGCSPATVNTHGRNLLAFFNWLNENGYENSLHFKHLKQSKKIKDVLTVDEVKAMLATSKGKARLMIAMMAFTGLRREEVTNIKVEDIRDCSIIIHGKGRKERKITLHDDVCTLLNEYLASRDTDYEYLFYSRKNFNGKGGEIHPLTAEAVRMTVKTAMLNAGIAPERVEKMSAHTMRRFFATYLAKNNLSLTKIQLLMGHESATTTAIYLQSAGAEIASDDLKALPSLV